MAGCRVLLPVLHQQLHLHQLRVRLRHLHLQLRHLHHLMRHPLHELWRGDAHVFPIYTFIRILIRLVHTIRFRLRLAHNICLARHHPRPANRHRRRLSPRFPPASRFRGGVQRERDASSDEAQLPRETILTHPLQHAGRARPGRICAWCCDTSALRFGRVVELGVGWAGRGRCDSMRGSCVGAFVTGTLSLRASEWGGTPVCRARLAGLRRDDHVVWVFPGLGLFSRSSLFFSFLIPSRAHVRVCARLRPGADPCTPLCRRCAYALRSRDRWWASLSPASFTAEVIYLVLGRMHPRCDVLPLGAADVCARIRWVSYGTGACASTVHGGK
ncbi:hypothetical protein DFH06DRAFT_707869 [Mycena polygramma]|nr:hypothetical protein DFH06DRAFT_707869 [Mycena polygramma]